MKNRKNGLEKNFKIEVINTYKNKTLVFIKERGGICSVEFNEQMKKIKTQIFSCYRR